MKIIVCRLILIVSIIIWSIHWSGSFQLKRTDDFNSLIGWIIFLLFFIGWMIKSIVKKIKNKKNKKQN